MRGVPELFPPALVATEQADFSYAAFTYVFRHTTTLAAAAWALVSLGGDEHARTIDDADEALAKIASIDRFQKDLVRS